MLFRYITFFLLILLSLVNISCAEENLDPVIDKVGYDGYLSDDTLIKIEGSNLLKCNNLSINGININTIDFEDEFITYSFGDYSYNSGFLTLMCGEDVLSNNYSFPYIDIVRSFNDNNQRKFEIVGKNFENGLKVYVNENEYINYKQIKNSKNILGDINFDKQGEFIFIEKDGLKSNKYDYNFNAPYITHIKAEDLFYSGNKAKIYGYNLFSSLNTYIKITELGSYDIDGNVKVSKIYNLNKNKEEGYISFNLPNSSGNMEFSLVSNNIESNKMNINIEGYAPILDKIYITGENIDGEYKQVLNIESEKLPLYVDKVKAYLNDTLVDIYYIDRKHIKIIDPILKPIDNFFYIEYAGSYSNVLNLYIEEREPYISYIESLGTVDDFRAYRIGIGNLTSEKTETSIYLDGRSIKATSCTTTYCRIRVSDDKLSGEIAVGLTLNQNISSRKDFDFTSENIAVVHKVEFKDGLNPYSYFEIKGINFLDSNISFQNFIDKEDNRYDIEVTSSSIKGRISKDYDENKNSSIKITKFGKTISLNFNKSNLNGNTLDGVPYLDSFENTNKKTYFKVGDRVKVNGLGFKESDVVVIGGKKIDFEYESFNQGYFIIPEDINLGNNNIYLENSFGSYYSQKDIVISDNDYNGELYIFNEKDNSNKVSINNNYKREKIAEFSILNKVGKIHFNEMVFEIEDYNKQDYAGLFKLEINGLISKNVMINDDGTIVFKNIDLEDGAYNQSAFLYKSSSFINKGIYNIKIKELDAYYYGTNNKLTKIDLNNFSDFKIIAFNEKDIYCYDTDTNNSNCNPESIEKEEISEKSNENEYIENDVSSSQEETKEDPILKVYNKIDDIFEKIKNNQKSKSYISKINYYKSLKFKVKKVLDKKKNHPTYPFLEYFYNSINDEYKKVFVEYVNLKK